MIVPAPYWHVSRMYEHAEFVGKIDDWGFYDDEHLTFAQFDIYRDRWLG